MRDGIGDRMGWDPMKMGCVIGWGVRWDGR